MNAIITCHLLMMLNGLVGVASSGSPPPFFMIADLDGMSYLNETTSYSLLSRLNYSPSNGGSLLYKNIGIVISNDYPLGLSDLILFNGNVLVIDDKTGMVLKLVPYQQTAAPQYMNMYPTATVKHWASTEAKFKTEWMTIKDDCLYVGSVGKKYIHVTAPPPPPQQQVLQQYQSVVDDDDDDNRSMYVYIFNGLGGIGDHQQPSAIKENWTHVYHMARHALNITEPGFVLHEAVHFSHKLRHWFLAPRKCSPLAFDVNTFDAIGCNVILEMDEDMTQVLRITHLPIVERDLGFSAIHPYHNDDDNHGCDGDDDDDDQWVGLLTRENASMQQTYFIHFNNNNGQILYGPCLFSSKKFEGISSR